MAVPGDLHRRHQPAHLAPHHQYWLLQPAHLRHRAHAVPRQAPRQQGARGRVRGHQRAELVVRERQPPPLARPQKLHHRRRPHLLRRAEAGGRHQLPLLGRHRRRVPRDGEPQHLGDRVGELVPRQHYHHFAQRLNFANMNVVSKNGSEQAINQTIDAHTEVGGGGAYAHQLHHSFPLYIFLGGNGSGTSSQRLMRKVQIGFVESRSGAVAGTSTLRNEQVAEAEVVLRDDQVAGASWRMHQVYNYGASNGGCYVRNVTSVGYDVLFDHDEASCGGTGRR
ncbi:hypothetical protein ACQ4PT_007128 [Festuca glaucescens]